MPTGTSSQPTVGYARHSSFQQAMLSLFWFANSVHWSAILIILLPQQALAIGGDAFKGRTLGLILAAAAVISIVAALIVGRQAGVGAIRGWLAGRSSMLWG